MVFINDMDEKENPGMPIRNDRSESRSCNQFSKSITNGNSSYISESLSRFDKTKTIPGSSGNQHNSQTDKLQRNSKSGSYSDFEERTEEDVGQSYSDSDSVASFENDFGSTTDGSMVEQVLHNSNYSDELDVDCAYQDETEKNSKHQALPCYDECRSGPTRRSRLEKAKTFDGQLGQDKYQRRKVQWANPESLNWSFHEGFETNANCSKRKLKRWNSTDDVISSTTPHYRQRRKPSSVPRNTSNRGYQTRDPPGHHIESPSVMKMRMFSVVSNPKKVEPSFRPQFSVPIERDDDVTKNNNVSNGFAVKASSKDDEGECLASGNIERTQGKPINEIENSQSSRRKYKSRLVKSFGGSAVLSASTPTPTDNQSVSQAVTTFPLTRLGSNSGSESSSCYKGFTTSCLAVSGNKSTEKSDSNLKIISGKAIGVLKEKRNTKIHNLNTKTMTKETLISKEVPRKLLSSLHDTRPAANNSLFVTSKLRSASLHMHSGYYPSTLAQDKVTTVTKTEIRPPSEMVVDDSSRSTEVSSDSPSFALQTSNSSLSSLQASEGSVTKTRPTTSPIMSSATLIICVTQARRLRSLQRTIFGKMKAAEPFVELYLGGKACGKTSIARRSINPTWKDNEIKCEVGGDMAREISSKREKLELRIYDRKSRNESFMGAVMFLLPNDDLAQWYNVVPRSEQAEDLFCVGATGSLEVKVQFSAKYYPELLPEHVLILKQNCKLALDLSWTAGSFLDTNCVATDQKDGFILWEESVYYANRTNPSRSIVFPERLELAGHPTVDTLVLDLINVPKNVGALCLVLVAREKTLDEVKSFEIRCKDAFTGQGIGRFQPIFKSNETSAILIRIIRGKTNKTWDLEVMEKGLNGFRDFGSMLPEIQAVARGQVAHVSRCAERTALMRPGDCIRINDYVETMPEKLKVGLFWKVANGENLEPMVLLLDENDRLLEGIHRLSPQSNDLSIIHDAGKFEITLSKVTADVKYICFCLGPYHDDQADHILTAAFHILNTANGVELVRSTIPQFDQFPTRTVTIGCFYRSEDSWNFAVLGFPSSDSTIDECTRTLKKLLLETPFGASRFIPA